MASWSDYAEKKILEHFVGKGSTTMPSVVAIALCTTVPVDADTGATIVEATYTGYARKSMTLPGDWNAAAGASPGSIATAVQEAFAACTALTSTIIGFALLDSATTGAGNMLCWGTVTSVVISATQTPAQIAAGALAVTQD